GAPTGHRVPSPTTQVDPLPHVQVLYRAVLRQRVPRSGSLHQGQSQRVTPWADEVAVPGQRLDNCLKAADPHHLGRRPLVVQRVTIWRVEGSLHVLHDLVTDRVITTGEQPAPVELH